MVDRAVGGERTTRSRAFQILQPKPKGPANNGVFAFFQNFVVLATTDCSSPYSLIETCSSLFPRVRSDVGSVETPKCLHLPSRTRKNAADLSYLLLTPPGLRPQGDSSSSGSTPAALAGPRPLVHTKQTALKQTKAGLICFCDALFCCRG